MIKLYLAENVPEAVAFGLRLRGFDVMTVNDTGHKGLSDFEQLQYAASENRAIFTFNVADFQKIHHEFLKGGMEHRGIILSKQLPIGIIVKALLKLLSRVTTAKVKNNIIWLSDWIKQEACRRPHENQKEIFIRMRSRSFYLEPRSFPLESFSKKA